jgi:hypothetical protein
MCAVRGGFSATGFHFSQKIHHQRGIKQAKRGLRALTIHMASSWSCICQPSKVFQVRATFVRHKKFCEKAQAALQAASVAANAHSPANSPSINEQIASSMCLCGWVAPESRVQQRSRKQRMEAGYLEHHIRQGGARCGVPSPHIGGAGANSLGSMGNSGDQLRDNGATNSNGKRPGADLNRSAGSGSDADDERGTRNVQGELQYGNMAIYRTAAAHTSSSSSAAHALNHHFWAIEQGIYVLLFH